MTFDDPIHAPIGDYPRVPIQWGELKDPYKYWDKQGRREYGDILYDHENYTDIWGPGVDYDWRHTAKGLGMFAGFMAFVYGLIFWWDPSEHKFWVNILFCFLYRFLFPTFPFLFSFPFLFD